MSKAIITDWIRSGCNIQQGIQLYAELSSNKQFLRLCNLQPKKYASKLIAQLRLIGGVSIKEFKQLQKEGSGCDTPRTLEVVPVVNKEKTVVVEQKDSEPKEKTKLREDYPFLGKNDCPHELSILVNRKITAYHNYVAAHQKLFDVTSLDECTEIAKELLENYSENRLIHHELEHYRDTNQCLGKHSIFEQKRKFSEYQKMNVRELIKLCDYTIPHRIWRIKDQLKNGNQPHLEQKRKQRLTLYEAELAEVKRILG